MLVVVCPNCGVKIQVEEKYAGKRGRCNSCGAIFRVHPPQPAVGGLGSPLAPVFGDGGPAAGVAPAPAAVRPAPANPFAPIESGGGKPSTASAGSRNPFGSPAPASASAGSGVAPPVSLVSLDSPFEAPPIPTLPAGPARPAPKDLFGPSIHASPPAVQAPAPPSGANPFAVTETVAPPLKSGGSKNELAGSNDRGGSRMEQVLTDLFAEGHRPVASAVAVPGSPFGPSEPPLAVVGRVPASPPAELHPVEELEDIFEPPAPTEVPLAAAPGQPQIELEPLPPPEPIPLEPQVSLSWATVESSESGQTFEPIDAPKEAVWTASPARSSVNIVRHTIEAIEAFLVQLPCRGTFQLAGGTYSVEGQPTPRVLVKVTGSNGVSGWGEVTPCPTWCYETSETILTTIRNYLAPGLVGLPAWNVEQVVRTMDRLIQPGATIGQPLAKSGIEMALHDYLARTLEVPLHVLLGSRRCDDIWLSYVVSAHSADEAASQTRQGLDGGYTAFKIKVGTMDEATDRGIVEAVRATAGPEAFLWVDANQGYDLDLAIRQAKFFGGLGVRAFEQPLRGLRISDFRRLVALEAVPIAIDETLGTPGDLLEYIRADAVDIPIAKLQRMGGYRASVRFCGLAETAGRRLMGSGLCETDLGLAHGVQLFAAFGIGLPCDLNGRQFVETTYLRRTVALANGRVKVPEEPGCGVEVDEEKVREYAVQTG